MKGMAKVGKGTVAAILMISVIAAVCAPVSAIDPILSDWATVAPSIDGNFIAGNGKNHNYK